MPDTDRTPPLPLAHPRERFRDRYVAASGLISLREIPQSAQISLRGDARDPAFCRAVQSVLSLEIPATPNTTSSAPSRITVLWLGPDEWLIVGEAGLQQRMITQLNDALGSLRSSVIDVSDARTIFEISGTRSRELLAKGCSLDLHPRAFHPGTCAQTNLAHANVIIQLLDRKPTWLLYVRISFADYLVSWLFDAMTRFCVSNSSSYEAEQVLEEEPRPR